MSEPQAEPAVVTAIVTSSLGLLLGRRTDGKPPWTFPGGEQEAGESDADTAVRETKEETGLAIKADVTLGQRVHPKSGRLMIYVACSPVNGSLDVHVGDPEELAEVRWVSLTEADELLPGMFEPVREHLTEVLAAG